MKPCVPGAAAIALCAVLFASNARAVNLVPNDSFETFASCPTSFGEIYQAVPWNAPTAGTSAYYNACVLPAPVAPDVPTNNFGVQNALIGVAYAGCIVKSAAVASASKRRRMHGSQGGTSLGAGTTCDTQPCEPVPARKRSWGALKTIYR